MKRNPIIVALDVDSGEEARMLVARLGEHIHFYKVGMKLYAAAGMPFVRELIAGGKRTSLNLAIYAICIAVASGFVQVRTQMRHIHPGAPGVGAGLSPVEVRLERDHNRIPHHAGHADRLNPAAGEDLGRVARVSRLHSEGRERIGQNTSGKTA
jgi:hypothetical protein